MADNEDLFGSEIEEEEELVEKQEDPKAKLLKLANRKRKEQEEEQRRQQEAKRSRFANEGDQQPSSAGNELFDDDNDDDPVENDTDRAFIDDEGLAQDEEAPWVDGSDGEGHDDRPVYEEAEEGEDDELDRALNKKQKRRKNKHDDINIKEFVEEFLTRMEASKAVDRELNIAGKPALEKLKMLPTVEEVVSQQYLHKDLLDAGIMGTLHDWLAQMPDGSLPNIKLRTSILKMLHQLPINTANENRKMQLRESKLGNLVMFLYKLPDETPSNRKLAKELIERWSKPIYEQFKDQKQTQQERLMRERQRQQRRLQAEEEAAKEEENKTKGLKPGDPGFRWHARIPQAAKLDYIREPEIDTSVKHQLKNVSKKVSAPRLQKKLKDLGKKKASGRAANVSIEGRGM